MSSRYQTQFSIPEGFPQLLKTFSREVLRCQPPNIYKFGARYFAQLVEARQVWEPSAPPGTITAVPLHRFSVHVPTELVERGSKTSSWQRV
jgi:hypothetical protein